ncbi:MAG TPA: peptidylprolyl isomerase [Puia sp.]|nr:peptidylprolyl isomerase [Puia sp.]
MSLRVNELFFVPLLLILSLTGVQAQTLFTIDNVPVSRDEFLRAYNKNNVAQNPTEKSYRDYLELYIRYKLKVRAAYDARLDTLPSQRSELQSFRSQVAESYLKDDTSLARLVKEAFDRSQKDIRLSHILILLPKNPTPADTLKAYEKARAAYEALKKGRKFRDVAMEYSEDPSVRTNGGDIGYITVFTLPYQLEDLAYSTPPGHFSKPWHTHGGYHIFRNDGERKALGRIRVAQILLAFPPSATAVMQESIRHKADSIYSLLKRGADFASLARTFSGDNLSYQAGGELPEFGIGRYDSAFEATAFGLDRDGAISRPLKTAFGYHIIKRIARRPAPRELDSLVAAGLRQQVMNDPRIEVSRKALLNRILQQVDYHRADIDDRDLWAFTDSAMLNTGLPSFRGLTRTTVLFSFSRQSYAVAEWLSYFRSVRGQRPGGIQVDKDLFDRWIERVAQDYYRNHLEEYNPDFAFQLTEFREGNLLFEIMQRKIWDKASTDSAGLRKYYEGHKDRYRWNPSADALLFTCRDVATAEALKARLQKYPVSMWRQMVDSAATAIQADSGRYELAQIPGSGGSAVAPQTYTAFSTNPADNSVSFAYILNFHADRSPRNFRDARGFVINDYQNWMEDQWIAELKKKYPVKVDEKMVAGLPH